MAALNLHTIPLELQSNIIEPLRSGVDAVKAHLDSCIRRCRSLHRLRASDRTLGSVCRSMHQAVNDSIPGVVITDVNQYSSARHLGSGSVARLAKHVLVLRMNLDGISTVDVVRWCPTIGSLENVRRIEVYGDAASHPDVDTAQAYMELEHALGHLIRREGSFVESVFCEPPVDVTRFCRESSTIRSFMFDASCQVPITSVPRRWDLVGRAYIKIPLLAEYPAHCTRLLGEDEYPSLRTLTIFNEKPGSVIEPLLEKVEDSVTSLTLFQLSPGGPPPLPLMSKLRILTSLVFGARGLFLWHLPHLEKVVLHGFPQSSIADEEEREAYARELDSVLGVLVKRVYTPSLHVVQLQGLKKKYITSDDITTAELSIYVSWINLCLDSEIALVDEEGVVLRVDEDAD